MDTQQVGRKHAGRRGITSAAEFRQLLARIRDRIPPEITPEETEEDIAAAREEVRQARRAARSR